MVDVSALVRPVVVTLLHSVLRKRGQHDDDHAAALPHHLQVKAQTSDGCFTHAEVRTPNLNVDQSENSHDSNEQHISSMLVD